jgi:hypothetical protein
VHLSRYSRRRRLRAQRAAVRQLEVPRKTEPTSPEPDTLIEELEEDDADVSAIVGEKDEMSPIGHPICPAQSNLGFRSAPSAEN